MSARPVHARRDQGRRARRLHRPVRRSSPCSASSPRAGAAPTSLEHLDEWGLGGRNFGGWISWFLIGGDLYTAYTFVAVPALLFGSGALGFFAVPYTIIIFPIVFIVAPRLWSVAHRHGYVTPADFVRGRHGSSTLALMIAITGIVATMPYIALQLVGIEAVLQTMGISGEWPLIIAFVILAAYTYQSGLRAPALIAFVKDTLIYIVVIVAVIYIPIKLGGFGDDLRRGRQEVRGEPGADRRHAARRPAGPRLLDARVRLGARAVPVPALGHRRARDRAAATRSAATWRRCRPTASCSACSRCSATWRSRPGVTPLTGSNGKPDVNTVVPLLFDKMFPDWFAGVAFAAIGIGALVPAAIMSIAAANLFTRNIYKEYLKRGRDARRRRRASASSRRCVVKVGAVVVILRARPAVLDRPAADRRRDHPADAAGASRSACTRARCTPGACSPGWAVRHGRRACTCSTTRRTRPRARRTSAARSTRCRTSASATRRRRSTRASSRWR